MPDRSSASPAFATYQDDVGDPSHVPLFHDGGVAPWKSAVRSVSWALAVFLLAAAFIDYALQLYHDQPLAAASAALLAILCAVGAVILGNSKGNLLAQFVAWQVSVISALAVVNIARPEIQPFGHQAPLWANTLNLTVERNLPTFYSSYLLVLVALAVTMCGRHERAVKPEWQRDRYVWPFVTLGFLFLALDETFMVHEALNDLLRRHLTIAALHGNYWTLVYFPIGVAALVVCLPWGRRLLMREPLMVGILAVGVGLEVLSPLLEIAGVTFAKQNALYKISATVEETAEMLAALAFFVAFARYDSSLTTKPGARDD